jgi:hypothetical protein
MRNLGRLNERTLALTSVLLLTFLGTYGCASGPREILVEKPVVVEIERLVPVTFEVPEGCDKGRRPSDPPSYGEVVELLQEQAFLLDQCAEKLESVRGRMHSAKAGSR